MLRDVDIEFLLQFEAHALAAIQLSIRANRPTMQTFYEKVLAAAQAALAAHKQEVLDYLTRPSSEDWLSNAGKIDPF